jgi:formiminotetrahydrofolate cyclodeaminase
LNWPSWNDWATKKRSRLVNLAELSLDQFTRRVASGDPTPGGGSAAALTAALSAALCAMVARLTVGKDKYRDSWKSMEGLRDTADDLAGAFLELVTRDTEAYNEVLAAFRLPKETEAQRSSRSQAIEGAMRQAGVVPLATLENLRRVADLTREALQHGNPNCLTDAGVAVHLMRAAAAGAAYNVRINLPGINDPKLAEDLLAHSSDLLTEIEKASAELEQMIEERLGRKPSS